jgi:hypothetical protein
VSAALDAQMPQAVRLQLATLPVASSKAPMLAVVSDASANSESRTTWPLGLSIVPPTPISDLPVTHGARATLELIELVALVTETRSSPATG